MKFGARHVYMDDLAGAAGGADGTNPAASDAGGATTPQPGGTAPAGQAGGAGADASASASALSGGNEWTIAAVPEKYQVKGADGQVDVAATLRKVDEGRAGLEKRMGEGGAAPKTADEYKFPETLDLATIGLDDASAKTTKEWAHGLKLNQAQLDGVMAKYASLAPALVQGAQADTVDSAVTALRETWGDKYDTNIKESFRVVNRVAAAAGMEYSEVEKAIGNNPVAIRLFAALAPEMREDATPAAANGAPGGSSQTADQYMAENWAAYSDSKSPTHKAVTERVNAMRTRELARK